MTDDARPIHRFMSGRQYPSDDCREPRYTKLSTDSTVFPLGIEILGGWFPEPSFCNLVLGHDKHRLEPYLGQQKFEACF